MLKVHNVLSRIAEFIKRDRKLIAVSLVAGLVITFAWGLASTAVYARNIQRGIAENVVRLHVLPNSNSESDQQLKLYVRDGVLDIMREFLTGYEDKAAVLALVEYNMHEIKARAYEIIREHGKDYSVTASITRERFPTRHYDGVTLPVGYYTAIRIDIGEAAGQNWWCVAFPPLCFVRATRVQTPSNYSPLQNVLTAQQYELVTITPESGTRLQARFRVVEIWNGIMR